MRATANSGKPTCRSECESSRHASRIMRGQEEKKRCSACGELAAAARATFVTSSSTTASMSDTIVKHRLSHSSTR
eukprot:scaffold35521_cov70-Phaeocystis_antarctica.AAC.3